jgi:opacity protein-like surface antigen/outer membrane protease
MGRFLVASVAAIALVASSARAAEIGPYSWSGYNGPYNWSGSYVGVTAGGAWGQYDPRTTADEGPDLDAAGAAAIGAAGTQSIKPTGFVAGIEGGYNWRAGNVLLGVEADLEAAHLNGAATSHSVTDTGVPFTITSYGNAEGLFTVRPRIGVVVPNNWLFYATGGLALTQLQSDFSFVSGGLSEETEPDKQLTPTGSSLESGRLNTTKAGYAVGGGVEAPLTDRLSVKADYLHVEFDNTAGGVTANINQTANVAFAHSSDLRADIFRAGLNYHFDGSDSSHAIMPLNTPVWKAAPFVVTDWEVEAGTRAWFSTGVDGEGPLLEPGQLVSRLIYSHLDAVSGEVFARVDHVSGLFAKGNLGAGGIAHGQFNDEDAFNPKIDPATDEPEFAAYSNTLSSALGHIGYGTIDLGYNFLRAPGAKVGAFVGYNYYAQAINTYGGSQVAGGSIFTTPDPPSLLGLTENDHFNSLRIGLSSEVWLSDQLRLTTDAAYVPWVNYAGLDNHLQRQLLAPDSSNSGDGVMLEGILDYSITPAWSVGVGGRYWAWNMNTGPAGFVFLTEPEDNGVGSSRYSTERYGVFVQSSYRWGGSPPPVALPAKAPVVAAAPMSWTGFYVGGHVGGGWSDTDWSDPFPSMPGAMVDGEEFINVAGFGDHTHATGPMGGGQIGGDWQMGPWVLGVQADASIVNMRGENTCFSGLGGFNCEHIVNALGTVTGRLGYAWGRELVYAKAGAAEAGTRYNLLGNAAFPGAGSTTLDTWGWTVGGGIEYSLTNHWSTFVEYDHIDLAATTVPFATIPVVNAQNIGVKQTVDLLKVGVNYKFDLAALIGAPN